MTTLDTQWEKDVLAAKIASTWVEWNGLRSKWMAEKKELREYLFATSTRDTHNNKLPWKNSTVTPKLTQIRDNLHANYLAALFPREAWFQWRAADNTSTSKAKRDAIEAYMRTKLETSGFQEVVSELVLDYIDYGNVFAGHEYVVERKRDPATNMEQVVYAGPRLYRISPLDVVINPTAPSFEKSPLIVRRLRSIGDLEQDLVVAPHLQYRADIVEKVKGIRVAGSDIVDALKGDGLAVDGFGSVEMYFASGMVELLDFYGDVYDPTTGTFHKDIVATVVDRRWMLRCMPNPSWSGSRPIKHVGWRLRPDNLWAQGPLDQLVGLQYRIDHLENLKADVFDQIAHPVVEIKGTTSEDFVFMPGTTFHSGDEGGLQFHRPDAAALSADMEIQTLMDRMEELAGAPRQAMGIRTPGEKTAYEVQVLENGAGRIFQSKVSWFERNLLEPLLNSMLEECVQNMGTSDVARMVDPDFGTEEFKTVTKQDIAAKGKFAAIGARHFAEQARITQEITQTLQLVNQVESVKAHISGKNIAKMLAETLGWKTFNIVSDNIAVSEAAETQRLMNAAQEQVQTEAGVPAELQPEDFVPPEEASESPTGQTSPV